MMKCRTYAVVGGANSNFVEVDEVVIGKSLDGFYLGVTLKAPVVPTKKGDTLIPQMVSVQSIDLAQMTFEDPASFHEKIGELLARHADAKAKTTTFRVSQ